MITESTSPRLSSEHSTWVKVVVKFDSKVQETLQDRLDYCRTKFGHRGVQSGWWWRPKKTFKEGIFIFTFKREEDALAFKITKG